MEYFTIAMGAPWFFPLFGGVLLVKVASDFVRGLRTRRHAEDAEEEAQPDAEEEAQETVRLHGVPVIVVKAVWATILVSGSFLLVILFAGALNTALDRKGAWAVWMFPALALCMLGGHISLACIVLRILPGKKRPRRDPASKIRWPLFCFGLCFAISGSFFIAAYLTAAVPQGQPVVTLPVRRAARCHWRCLCRLRGAQAIQGCARRGSLAAHLSALRGDGAGGRAHLPALREAGAGGEGESGNLRARPFVKEGN